MEGIMYEYFQMKGKLRDEIAKKKGTYPMKNVTPAKIAETLLAGKSILFQDGITTVLDKTEFSLAELYEIIGCKMVEYVPLTVGALNGQGCLWCDEEGLINKSEINKLATEVLSNQIHGGILRGTILVTPETAGKSDFRDVIHIKSLRPGE